VEITEARAVGPDCLCRTHGTRRISLPSSAPGPTEAMVLGRLSEVCRVNARVSDAGRLGRSELA
jgi:hypothetical protein